jgi:type III secretion system YscD/HrpQ family protein
MNESDSGNTCFRLRVVSGTHEGAARTLRRNDLVVIGTADDCDVILADVGVAPRHCVIGVRENELRISALDVSTRLGTGIVRAGSSAELVAGVPLHIGEAELIVDVAALSEHADGAAAPPASSRATPRARAPLIGVVLGALASGLVLTTALSHNGAREENAEDARLRIAELVEGLRATPRFAELTLATTSDERPLITGFVPDASARAELLTLAPGASVQVAVGDDLAMSVRKALRAYGINSETRYLGGGDVEVLISHVDEDAAKQTIGLETKRGNLRALANATIVLVDEPRTETAAPRTQTDEKEIVRLVDGADPHVRTRDGSTYGLGATLPDGGMLLDVDADRIAVMYGEHVREYGLADLNKGGP